MEKDYKKLYEEALERAKYWAEGKCMEDFYDSPQNVLNFIFPETKESEDEKIRKWIINEIKIKHHNLDEDNVDFVDKAIAWLEKQGEQKPQPISVPFVRIVDDCVAKCCWEHGGVCINPHRDCIDCPKNWNLEFNTYVGTSIEGSLSADPKDWHVTIKPKISEDTAWNTNIKGACKLSVAPEVKCGEVCDHCISQPMCDKPEKCKVKVESLPEDADKTTWTERDEDMLSDCISAVMAWWELSDERHKEMVDWLRDRFNKEGTSND